jgi:hypothetical protein
MQVPQNTRLVLPAQYGLSSRPKARRVPHVSLLRRGFAGCLLALTTLTAHAQRDRPTGPAVKITLETLGIPSISPSFLDVGSSMLTVHFLDAKHVMLTYGTRGLVPRLPNEPPGDDDRIVGAKIIELPMGRVVAHTEWHMHDHARYLWALGNGRFLLRIARTLYLMEPGNKLSQPDPFARTVFPGRQMRPSAVFVSEDGELLTLEAQQAARKAEVVLGDSDSVREDVSTLMEFYRLKGDGSETSPITVAAAGSVRSPQPFYLPIDSRGYLWPTEVGNNQWQITFDDMQGKTAPMGTLESSCTPRLEMVSHGEFLAMTCRGNEDHVRLASFGLDAKMTWQEDFSDFGPPTFQYAPVAGRFALSRRVAGGVSGPPDPNNPPVQLPDHQEVRVYQTASGDSVLKIDATPAIKTAENFSLAEDGSALAVIREDALEIFKLRPNTKQEKEDIEDADKISPPRNDGPVLLALLTGGKHPSQPEPAAKETTVASAGEPAAKSSATVPAGPIMAVRDDPSRLIVGRPIPTQKADADIMNNEAGDDTSVAAAAPRRKPPTLLLPGERAEFGNHRTLTEDSTQQQTAEPNQH